MKIEKVALTLKPNYKYIPVTITHNYEEWNEIYISLLNNKDYHYNYAQTISFDLYNLIHKTLKALEVEE